MAVLADEQKPPARFDLDFPGGTPRDLVNAIDKAQFGPHYRLNVIIPEDCAQLRIPAISVQNVTLPQLFAALTSASRTGHLYRNNNPGFMGGNNWSTGYWTYGFRTEGDPTENSIWTFYQDKPAPEPPPAPYCRFYQLSPYLESGYKVEDITTAIETAWKMMGATNPPQIKYHKDTKLLIAVGSLDNLGLIDEALQQLSKASPNKKVTASQDSDKTKSR